MQGIPHMTDKAGKAPIITPHVWPGARSLLLLIVH